MKRPLGMEVNLDWGHIVLDGVAAPPRKGHSSPLFWPMSIVATVAHLGYCWALVVLITVACISLCAAKTVIFYVLFFVFDKTCRRILRRPWTDFRETLPNDVVCSKIDCVLYGSVHTYVPSKNLRGENHNFRPFADSKSTLWASSFYSVTEIGKSKTTGSICGWVRTSNMFPLPTDEIRCSFGVGKCSNRYNFGCATAIATRCLILAVGFPDQPIRRRYYSN